MSRRVLIIPDKFKSTLSAHQAAAAIARGWGEVRPSDSLELLPMSDGGDGFGEVLASLLQLAAQEIDTLNAAHRPWSARWWWSPEGRTAVIESAQVVGLAVLPPKRFHPFELDSFGLGAVLEAAALVGAKRCLIGIGGSATNDGGFGLARALGWQFRNDSGQELMRWSDLQSLHQIAPPRWPLSFQEITVAVDVQNPLLGPTGASRVYGPQKGLQPHDFPCAEACLSRLADVAEKQLGGHTRDEPGTGAAGGLGFGLRTFLQAGLESGFKLFARHAQLEERIGRADLVLTGEGAIDRSSLMGKGVGEVARLCRERKVTCLGLAGQIAPDLAASSASDLFATLYGIVPQLSSPEAAFREPAALLERLAAHAATRFQS